MGPTHVLTRAEARRIAVRAQALAEPRPEDLISLIRHLSLLQLSTTRAVAPSADLVAWSRMGSTYDPSELADALDEQRLIEFRGTVRLPEDIALYRAEMSAWPGEGELRGFQKAHRAWVNDNEAGRLAVLEALRGDGPLTLRELPDECVRSWKSSGWNNNKTIEILVEFMVQRGEVAAAGRRGTTRLWDLAERVYPDDPPIPLEQAGEVRNARRLRALGIARPKGPACPAEPVDVGDAGVPAVVEGVAGRWRVDPDQLGRLHEPLAGRTVLLSPLDRLLHDRKRMAELFTFDYALEMYKPAARRRWGYWALPILHGEELVGKVDAVADRPAGILRVNAVHWDTDASRALRTAVDEQIDDLAFWLDLEPHREPS